MNVFRLGCSCGVPCKDSLVQADAQVCVLLDGRLSDAALEVGDLCVEAEDLILQQLGVTPAQRQHITGQC
eukprot:1161078-Pelagomonas_calceolata.AAC.13